MVLIWEKCVNALDMRKRMWTNQIKNPNFGEGILNLEGFTSKVTGKAFLELLGGSLALKIVLLKSMSIESSFVDILKPEGFIVNVTGKALPKLFGGSLALKIILLQAMLMESSFIGNQTAIVFPNSLFLPHWEVVESTYVPFPMVGENYSQDVWVNS